MLSFPRWTGFPDPLIGTEADVCIPAPDPVAAASVTSTTPLLIDKSEGRLRFMRIPPDGAKSSKAGLTGRRREFGEVGGEIGGSRRNADVIMTGRGVSLVLRCSGFGDLDEGEVAG